MGEQHWIFVVQTLNQPGSLSAAAAVFSNRGVSLEGVLGSGIDASHIEEGRLVFSFYATLPKQQLLKRALERLSTVSQVVVYPYEDERLRAIALVKLDPEVKLSPETNLDPAASYRYEIISPPPGTQLVMLTGPPPVVQRAIAHFRQEQQLLDVVMSYIMAL